MAILLRAGVRGLGSMCVCVCVCFVCVMGGRTMRGSGHFVLRKCARFGVNVCVCVCVRNGFSDYEGVGPFCFAQVCEVWDQCVCVMGGRIMRGFGRFA